MNDLASSNASAPTSRRWFHLLLLAVTLALAGGSYWWWSHRQSADASHPTGSTSGRMRDRGGPAVVTVSSVKADSLRIDRIALGTVTALSTVTIRTQISGRLDRLHFTEGQTVAVGDLLAEIDDRPFALSLAQYQGQLARDEAQLSQAELDLARYKTLVEQDSLPRQQLETQQTLVNQLRGTTASDRAQVDSTKLNLAYCKITAPAAGQIGLRLVDAGNYVTPGDASGLATITQFKPISVIFTLPETDLSLLLPEVRAGHVLSAQILDRDGVRELTTGTLSTVDNAIDPTTGTLRMRVTAANDDHRLFPNQFVNVRLLIRMHAAAAVIPLAAVQRNARGAYVWTIDEGAAKMKPVRLGIESHDQVEVLDGVSVGEQVVVDGVDRLRDGAPVTVSTGEQSGAGGDGGSKNGKPREHKRDTAPTLTAPVTKP
jgi:membrane fusion protein, multidrug efflux system